MNIHNKEESISSEQLKQDRFFTKIDENHSALFVRQSSKLIVTFGNMDDERDASLDSKPWGFDFVQKQGWSILGIRAIKSIWYRSEDVYNFFDKLRDEKFYDQFDDVVFYGASMGGYAAAVFSSTAPNSSVVMISPQATLDKKIVPWETRYRRAWNADYTSKYGYGPELVKAAKDVTLFYDPYEPLDRMHAEIFMKNPNVNAFKAVFCGHRQASLFAQVGILKPIILGALNQKLQHKEFRTLIRNRKKSLRYHKAILDALVKNNRHKLIMRHVDAMKNYGLEWKPMASYRRQARLNWLKSKNK